PRHFKNSADIGTIAVRYVVEGQSVLNTRLQIDAVFVEDGGHKPHASDGTVETSEFREIQDRIRVLDLQKKKADDFVKSRQSIALPAGTPQRQRQEEVERLQDAESSLRSLRDRLHDLQHELEVRVKDPGADLKSAPFHNAT